MKPYDLLLVHAHRDSFAAFYEDVSIGTNLLAGTLRARGFEVGYFRGFAVEAAAWIRAEWRGRGARAIGFYCDYENETLIAEMGRGLRAVSDLPLIVGGPQACFLQEDFFRRSGCWAAVRGEAEDTVAELLALLRNGSGSREGIAGISFPGPDGRLIRNPDREPIADLNALPWPDFTMEKNHAHWVSLPVLSGRGCPFRCGFCFQGAVSTRVRLRSVAEVMREIRHHFAVHANLRSVYFVDDTFTLHPGRVGEFCEELARLRQERDFVWFCEGHVQTLHRWPEMAEQMAAAGLVKIFIGVESGSDRVLQLYRKQTTAAMIEETVGQLVRAGIPQVVGNIILGGPQESPDTVRESRELVFRLLDAHPGRFDCLGFFLVPFPGTAVAEQPDALGLRLLDHGRKAVVDDIPFTETESLSFPDLFRIRREFHRQTLTRMRELFLAGQIPRPVLESIYHLHGRYGIGSRWMQNIFRLYPMSHRYYSMLAGKAIRSPKGVSCVRIRRWRPRRLFEIWNGVRFTNGYPELAGIPLSPLEYELLLPCTGKLTLDEILEKTFPKFQERFPDRAAFRRLARQLLLKMEARCWIGFHEA